MGARFEVEEVEVGVVITGEDTEVGVGVRETGKRGKGVDRWVVRGVFRVEVRGISLLKPGKSEG